MKNNRAEIFFKAAWEEGAWPVTHVYDDGFVVIIIADEQVEAAREVLRAKFPDLEEYWSEKEQENEGLICWVVETDLPETPPDWLVDLTPYWSDHRQEDHHTLDLAVPLLEEYLEAVTEQRQEEQGLRLYEEEEGHG